MEATADDPRRYRWLPWFLGACVIASLATVALTQRDTPSEDTTVPKPNGPAIDLFIQHPDGRQTVVRRGDNVSGGMLRIRVSLPAPGRLGIVAASEGDSVRSVRSFAVINAGRRQMLPETITLSGRGPERLIAIVCPEEESVYDGDLLVNASAALQEAGGDPRKMEKLPLPCSEAAVWYEKR